MNLQDPGVLERYQQVQTHLWPFSTCEPRGWSHVTTPGVPHCIGVLRLTRGVQPTQQPIKSWPGTQGIPEPTGLKPRGSIPYINKSVQGFLRKRIETPTEELNLSETGIGNSDNTYTLWHYYHCATSPQSSIIQIRFLKMWKMKLSRLKT
jgi:hypothetical protein